MTEQEVITKFFEVHPEWKADANISFLIEKSSKPLSVENLFVAALMLRDTLLIAPEYESAWQDYKFYHPGQTGLAHRANFIEKRRAQEVHSAAAAEYESLIKKLGEKFRGQSLERLREVAEKRRVHGLTASQFLAEQPKKPKQRGYDGYPILPEFLVLPGNVQATRIDGAFLQNLVKQDYFLYRRLFNKFGGQQLTDRQNAATAVVGE